MMTPDAKRQLSTTIRALRERLLDDLQGATEARYQLSVIRITDTSLDEAGRTHRKRLQSYLSEQVRAQGKVKKPRTASDFLRDVEKQAAYTLLNRLIILRLMEAAGLRKPELVRGGWNSRAYKDFRELAPALIRNDDTEGYRFLLNLAFDDLAAELPGIFAHAGVAELIPIPAATLRHLIESLDDPELASCWDDDMTLGWVYQYWNDPEREALDAKLNSGGKVERHEIASKTQMFTERYMVNWLLQNSLGPMWLAICQKNGWTPEAESTGTLAELEKRREVWRAKRDNGEVELTELMPLHNDMERRWAYYVPQPIPEDAIAKAPTSVRELKILDPAVGSGHFLVVAFELLFALYEEEHRHLQANKAAPVSSAALAPPHQGGGRREAPGGGTTGGAIVESILENNLHGIDLDPRAVQIAAAALWLKALSFSREASPRKLNLVASNLNIASLPDDDPALLELRREVERDTGIPAALTDTVVHALKGADHLGSLLKVDAAVAEAIQKYEKSVAAKTAPQQGSLFGDAAPPQQVELDFDAEEAQRSLLDSLEGFLAQHTSGEDLGLRLRGEQLAAGVRFVRMIREGTYDLVVGNPPYQGTSKIQEDSYIKKHYKRGKADLYAAFLERAIQLAAKHGTSALLTMRNWMFIKQYSDLREWLLETFDLRALGDFDRGAFEEIPDEVVSVVVSIFRKVSPIEAKSIALQPTPPDDTTRDSERTNRKRAAVLCQVGRYAFEPQALRVVPEWPLVYWWDEELLQDYREAPLFGNRYTIYPGVKTGDNVRFLRLWHEIRTNNLQCSRHSSTDDPTLTWKFYLKGAAGAEWFEPGQFVVNWGVSCLELGVFGMYCNPGTVRLREADLFFRGGIAFAAIGATFSARAHRFHGVFDNMGPTALIENPGSILCYANSKQARSILSSLNPGIHFQIGDIYRLPLMAVTQAAEIADAIENHFTEHESHREPSFEFRFPGSSPWRYTQEWAQQAVNRPEDTPLPPYEPVYDPEPPTDHISYALGIALGRFHPEGEGILDPTTANLDHALPSGILFLDGTLNINDQRDSLGLDASKVIHDTWTKYGARIDAKSDVRTYLRLKFFDDIHRQMYENKPIHWPLSSQKKTFVAWVTIHRMNAQTLRVLLADHLHPALSRLEGELDDLKTARDSADKKISRAAEKRYAKVVKYKDELTDFIKDVTQCSDKGPLPPKKGCPPREVDARYDPDLDDGVMINSAALWPLLHKQWKHPRKWWTELAKAKGRKDYDWSHLAMRYWPTRVDKKCQEDPSLGVAHGCFWKYHPERAWAWELRLQDEIDPDFRIREEPYRGDTGDTEHRTRYLREKRDEAIDAVEKEATRRMGRGKNKKIITEILVLEPGLWSGNPEKCWNIELALSQKQGVEFRIFAPDGPDARDAYAEKHPDKAKARTDLIASLEPPPELFEDDDEDEDVEESEDLDIEDDDDED